MALHEATNPQRLRFGVDKGGPAPAATRRAAPPQGDHMETDRESSFSVFTTTEASAV